MKIPADSTKSPFDNHWGSNSSKSTGSRRKSTRIQDHSNIIVVTEKSPSAKSLLLTFLQQLEVDVSEEPSDGKYHAIIEGKRAVIHPTYEFTKDEAHTSYNLIDAVLNRRLATSTDLLVFLLDRPTISSSMRQHYDILFNVACNSVVPAVLVCAMPDHAKEDWWSRASTSFKENYKMEFKAFASLRVNQSPLQLTTQRFAVRSLIADYQRYSPYQFPELSTDSLTAFEEKCSDFWRDIITPDSPEYDQLFFEALEANEKDSNCSSSLLNSVRQQAVEDVPKSPRNIIFFGQTGSGKSSVINLLLGEQKAPVGDSADGVTAQSTCYKKRLGGEVFNLWDTTGLGENVHGTVTPAEAIRQITSLVMSESGKDQNGIHLLVFVFRGRIDKDTSAMFKIVEKHICGERVPSVIVVTGLENDPTNNMWWFKNKEKFEGDDMRFHNAACVVANASQAWSQEYERSREKVDEMLLTHASVGGWKAATYTAFEHFIAKVLAELRIYTAGFNKKVYDELTQYLQGDAAAAYAIVKHISKIKADSSGGLFSWLWPKKALNAP